MATDTIVSVGIPTVEDVQVNGGGVEATDHSIVVSVSSDLPLIRAVPTSDVKASTVEDSPPVEPAVEPVQNGSHISENGTEPSEPSEPSPVKDAETPQEEASNENQEPTEIAPVEPNQETSENASVEPEVVSDEPLVNDIETTEEQTAEIETAQSNEIVETEKEQSDQKESEDPRTTVVEVVQTTINGTATDADESSESGPATVQVTTTTTFTTKVTVTSESTEEEPSVEGSTDGHPGGTQGGEPGDDLLDEGPEVSLSREEELLLEKLKYQPFAVAQDIQNLTPQQREKINLYQRRESLARVNSLKRQSPSVSISLSTKRASESSQGRRGSDFTPLNNTNIDNSASRTLNEEKPVDEKPDEEKENEQPPVVSTPEEPEEKVVDTSSGVYQQMKLFTPKPYSHSIESTQPNSGATSPRNAFTPNLSQARKTNPDQRYSTLPLSTDYSKMQSAGDLSPSSPKKAITPTGDSRRVDRSQSVKETQEEIDRMRKHVYEMKLKFLGEPVPAVYPYPLQTDDDPLKDEIVEDDVIDAPKNVKQVESSNPSALQKPSKSKKQASSDKEDKKDKPSPKKPASNPFYKLLCGSNKSKDYADEEQY